MLRPLVSIPFPPNIPSPFLILGIPPQYPKEFPPSPFLIPALSTGPSSQEFGMIVTVMSSFDRPSAVRTTTRCGDAVVEGGATAVIWVSLITWN